MKRNIITNWDELPVVLDTSMVALIFGISIGTVKQWIYEGRIQAIRINRQYFFDRDYIRGLFSREIQQGEKNER